MSRLFPYIWLWLVKPCPALSSKTRWSFLTRVRRKVTDAYVLVSSRVRVALVVRLCKDALIFYVSGIGLGRANLVQAPQGPATLTFNSVCEFYLSFVQKVKRRWKKKRDGKNERENYPVHFVTFSMWSLYGDDEFGSFFEDGNVRERETRDARKRSNSDNSVIIISRFTNLGRFFFVLLSLWLLF